MGAANHIDTPPAVLPCHPPCHALRRVTVPPHMRGNMARVTVPLAPLRGRHRVCKPNLHPVVATTMSSVDQLN